MKQNFIRKFSYKFCLKLSGINSTPPSFKEWINWWSTLLYLTTDIIILHIYHNIYIKYVSHVRCKRKKLYMFFHFKSIYLTRMRKINRFPFNFSLTDASVVKLFFLIQIKFRCIYLNVDNNLTYSYFASFYFKKLVISQNNSFKEFLGLVNPLTKFIII